MSGLRIALGSASVEEAALGRVHGAMVGALALMGVLPHSLTAQRGVPDQTAIDAYHAAVGRAFSVSSEEVGILAEWPLRSDEIVVVLFVARSAGVSPDAVASLRSAGRRWANILRIYSVDAGALRISFPAGTDLGPLEETYRTFAETPRSSWIYIELPDRMVIALVNVRTLARALRVTVRSVLRAWGGEGDFVSVHQRLTG